MYTAPRRPARDTDVEHATWTTRRASTPSTASSAAGCSMPPIHCGRRSGVDPAGGFFERLGQDGKPLAEPRRSRVTPRQAYCFAMGPSLGWKRRCRGAREARPRFLVREVPASRRTVPHAHQRGRLGRRRSRGDLRPGLRAARVQSRRDARRLARRARTPGAGTAAGRVEAHEARHGGGFENGVPTSLPLESNPHMHLFEATLAGCEVSSETQPVEAAGRRDRGVRARAFLRSATACCTSSSTRTGSSRRA